MYGRSDAESSVIPCDRYSPLVRDTHGIGDLSRKEVLPRVLTRLRFVIRSNVENASPEVPSEIEAPGVSEASSPASSGTQEGIPSTAVSRMWRRVIPTLVLAVIITVFTVENSMSTTIHFFGLSGRVPLAVALLGSVALGALLIVGLSSIRILQLRKIIHQLQGSQDTPKRRWKRK